MEFHHEPVMLKEVLEWLEPKLGGIYADGTLGGGGHSEAILRLAGQSASLYGIDRDTSAIAAASRRLEEYRGFHPIHGNFHEAKQLLAEIHAPLLDGALLDLGVSSHQLDTPERGFSYHEDAPLDMRMDVTSGITAASWLSGVSQQELTRVLFEYGEERWAARIAEFVIKRRKEAPIATTGDLVRIIDDAIPKAVRMKDDGHPARRTFQAIRIAVNDELAPLSQALSDFMDCLKPGGRLCVITFHSLEDRLTKQAFRTMQNPCVCPPRAPVCTCGRKPVARVLAGGAIKPSPEEVASNPRARSAKLRVAEKI
jgi:16S rRNA (cytosine1402-N4)-methyltransferase